MTLRKFLWNLVGAAIVVALGIYAGFPLWMLLVLAALGAFPVPWWPRAWQAIRRRAADPG